VTADPHVEIGGAELARPLFNRICDLYDEVFSEPPSYWQEEESELHRGRLLRLLDDPTFGITAALDGDELIGFAYGFRVPPDTKRWTRLAAPVSVQVSAEWPGRTFMLFDYAVRRRYRGRGIGRRLHHRLLGSRPEERATLSVEPGAVESKKIYEHWGWHQVGQSVGQPGDSSPIFDVYLRDNLDDLRAYYAKP